MIDTHSYHGVDRFHNLQHLLLVNSATVIDIVPGGVTDKKKTFLFAFSDWKICPNYFVFSVSLN